MATDNNFARVLKTTLPPTIARKLVTLTPLRSVPYHVFGSSVRAAGLSVLRLTGNPVVAFGLPAHTSVKRIAVGSSGTAGSAKNVSWRTAQTPCIYLRTGVAANPVFEP